jgi:hypothetical protein
VTRGHHAVEDFADAGAGGERGKEDFGFLGGSGNGGAQIEGEEGGEGGGLRGVGGGGELGGEAGFEEGPAGGAIGGVEGHGAEVGPELDEGAEDGGFGELAAEEFAELDCGQLPFAVEGLESAEDDGGGMSGGRGFPLAIAADGGDPGKDVGRDEEVGLFGKCAEEVEGDETALVDEASGQFGGSVDGGGRGRDARGAEAGLHEGRGGRGELGVAREEEAEAEVIEEAGGVVERAQGGGGVGGGGLVPQRGTRDL